eukprot:9225113-Pyramimonas_sp.AAC.1
MPDRIPPQQPLMAGADVLGEGRGAQGLQVDGLLQVVEEEAWSQSVPSQAVACQHACRCKAPARKCLRPLSILPRQCPCERSLGRTRVRAVR